jgi:hypothetical protein
MAVVDAYAREAHRDGDDDDHSGQGSSLLGQRRQYTFPTTPAPRNLPLARTDTLPPQVPIPNAERAVIAVEKLTQYLLNPSHKRGGAKARLLLSLGYRTDAPQVLESDLRAHHCL